MPKNDMNTQPLSRAEAIKWLRVTETVFPPAGTLSLMDAPEGWAWEDRHAYDDQCKVLCAEFPSDMGDNRTILEIDAFPDRRGIQPCYLAFKRTDILDALSDQQLQELDGIITTVNQYRTERGAGVIDGVFVRSEWPIYPKVTSMMLRSFADAANAGRPAPEPEEPAYPEHDGGASIAAAPPRPVANDELQLLAALDLVKQIPNLDEASHNDAAEVIANRFYSHMDGYELAKEVEDSWPGDIDAMTVDALDGMSHCLDEIVRKAQADWARAYGIKPPLAKRTRVQFRDDTGVIDGLSIYNPGCYEIIKDGDEMAVTNNRRFIVEFEKCTAISEEIPA